MGRLKDPSEDRAVLTRFQELGQLVLANALHEACLHILRCLCRLTHLSFEGFSRGIGAADRLIGTYFWLRFNLLLTVKSFPSSTGHLST